MRRPAACLLAVSAVLAGCNQPEPVAPPQGQPQAQAPAPAGPPPAPPVSYACESGQAITVQYPDTATAQLSYKGQPYALRLTQAPTGARYAGPGLEWWVATAEGGQETATLSRTGPNDDIGIAVLERCSRPTAGSVPTGPVPAPGQTVTPIPGQPLPPAQQQPANAPACRSAQLRLTVDGGDAGAGNRGMVVGVQNTAPQPCSLTGYPGVALQDARGRALTAIRTEQSPGGYLTPGQQPQAVVVAPQAKVFFDVLWTVVPSNNTPCPAAARLRVTPPGDAAPINLDQAFSPCGARIRVTPFRAQGGASVGNPVSA
jgi:membrane-bound inhibitor of C-type lysozyme